MSEDHQGGHHLTGGEVVVGSEAINRLQAHHRLIRNILHERLVEAAGKAGSQAFGQAFWAAARPAILREDRHDKTDGEDTDTIMMACLEMQVRAGHLKGLRVLDMTELIHLHQATSTQAQDLEARATDRALIISTRV